MLRRLGGQRVPAGILVSPSGEDVALVVRVIKEKYGFTVTPAYARDFIKFVNEVING
jgi:hypothetical protein